ncbi:polysaccharide deacetylase family protein [Flavobacteriaceae bacterium]|nr:polysaccharide deacetylase family protein [Flavobacteriaceae bacterium]
MLYLVKTPDFIKRLFQNLTWEINTSKKVIYLTFDDGPTPKITNWVLYELEKYNAKATFFCIGKNILNHPDVFENIVTKGHAIGNHTNNHINSWKKQAKLYIENVNQAQKIIDPVLNGTNSVKLFRPPYGKLTLSVTKKLVKEDYKIIMWDVLSGDFDQSISKEKCLKNVIENTTSGSIIVFHDSVKASEKLQFTLPKILDHFSKKGFSFEIIK